MKYFILFIAVLLSVGILTGVITQTSSASDIENSATTILNGFVNQINMLSDLGRSAFEIFQKAVKSLGDFWDAVKSVFNDLIQWFNWRAGGSI